MVATLPSYQEQVDDIIAAVVTPGAAGTDARGDFPRSAVDALGKEGLLGLVSAAEAGGRGEGLRAAAWTCERLAGECASTAMVTCMHYCAAAVIEAHGPSEARRAVAGGTTLATLAFSESGSRSHFWAPVST